MAVVDGRSGTWRERFSGRWSTQAERAADRYRHAEPGRAEIERRRAAGMRYPDDVERLALRAARLRETHGVSGGVAVAEHASSGSPEMLERIVGATNDLQMCNFLTRGVRAAAAVARIWYTAGGPVRAEATGFLVSPLLLLTNHHVFPDAETARQALAEFGAEAGIDNSPPAKTTRYEPDPDTLYLADEDLDFALVALRPGDDGRLPGDVYGHIPLVAAEGKLVVGDPVNIVGHPEGRLKEIAIRENRLTQRLEHFLHYLTDTQPGNSGSPVFNDQWEAVALHHAGVPDTDDQGRWLNLDGQPWEPDQPPETIRWRCNEGVRISVVLRRLDALATTREERDLLAQLGPESGLAPEPAPEGGAAPAAGPEGAGGTAPGAGSVPAPRSAGAAAPAAGPDGPRNTEAVVPAQRAAGAVEGPYTGLPGRAGAFGGRAQLVFVHGRGQEGRNPAVLRRAWTAGLNHGLTREGLATIDPGDVWFPYYGDRLPAAGERLGAGTGPSGVPVPPAARDLYVRMLTEAAARAGMPAEPPGTREDVDDLFGVLHRPLDWLAAHTGVDRLVIAAAFGDVASYLDDGAVRDAVLEQVLRTVPESGPPVLFVAHSLGTVVAMDLLTRLPGGTRVAGLVTLGSPLGMDTVHSRLLVGGPACPSSVPWWFNGWCPADPVTIGCPLADEWSGLTAEESVDNSLGRVHDVEEYLAHGAVASVIGRALG